MNAHRGFHSPFLHSRWVKKIPGVIFTRHNSFEKWYDQIGIMKTCGAPVISTFIKPANSIFFKYELYG
jgi:hypothetical protein